LKTLSSTSTLRDIIPALVLFLQDTATTETPTLSLHDALPIFAAYGRHAQVSLWRSLVYPPTPGVQRVDPAALTPWDSAFQPASRSEEHTSEVQSRENLVCRLLLEKKKH